MQSILYIQRQTPEVVLKTFHSHIWEIKKKYSEQNPFHHSNGCQTKWLSLRAWPCQVLSQEHVCWSGRSSATFLRQQKSVPVLLGWTDKTGWSQQEKHAEASLLLTPQSAHREATVYYKPRFRDNERKLLGTFLQSGTWLKPAQECLASASTEPKS